MQERKIWESMRLAYIDSSRRTQHHTSPIVITEDIKRFLSTKGRIIDAVLFSTDPKPIVPIMMQEFFDNSQEEWKSMEVGGDFDDTGPFDMSINRCDQNKEDSYKFFSTTRFKTGHRTPGQPNDCSGQVMRICGQDEDCMDQLQLLETSGVLPLALLQD
jgi:hypothetical protein